MSTRATERPHGADAVVRRRALWASAATGAGAVFTLVDYTPLNFVVVDGRIAVVLLLLAAVGAAGALLHQKVVMIGVGEFDTSRADELSGHTFDRFNGRWSRGL